MRLRSPLFRLLALLSTLYGAAPAMAGDHDGAEVYTIGVLAFRDAGQTAAQWQPTADYLSAQIDAATFRVQALNYPELNRAVAARDIDFVLTNTGHYVRLEAEQGITRLATLIAEEQGQPIRQFGGTILVRDDRAELQSLDDLRGQRLLAVDADSLGGWLAGHEALRNAGVEPQDDLAALGFTGMPHHRVIEGLLAGDADAGIVRTGVLEGQLRAGTLAPGTLRVLGARETADFPFAHSTRLYPEWPFSRLEHTPDPLAEAVSIALLSLPSDHPAVRAGGYHGWSAPLSYASVHTLLEELGRPPYDRPVVVDLRAYWEARPEVLLGFLAGLLLLSGLAALYYRRLTTRLSLEVEQRRAAEARLRTHEAELAYQAGHDPLTGLPNRTLLQECLHDAMQQAREANGCLAILFVDLDRFKTVNDSLGHRVGDDLLQILGERLKTRFEARTIARIGGDEFVVIIEDAADHRELEARARQLLALIAEPFAVGGWSDLQVGASIGIALYPDDATEAGELITQADAAMYEAKDAGRNTFRFYRTALTDAASQRLEIENRLRRALAQGELEVYYQPQIQMTSGVITGIEALVRWRDPEHGLVTPDVFIPLAEETGLIVDVGAFVLRVACRQVVDWDRAGLPPLEISVNLSARQVAAPGLLHQVRQVLQETGLPARRLTLELTESTLMEQAETTRGTLQQLKQLGVALAIDDFGTGYSSLAYLKEFAIDILKIDQTFVRDLPEDRSDAELAVTIIGMAHNLGLDVLAEGVENAAQLGFLATQGCDAWQGYLCSRPLPADALAALVRQHAPEHFARRTAPRRRTLPRRHAGP
ncbi:bifunctional diguanylate cyclase/phosphodiesterase [Thioalkalivibrio sp. ALE30]|uniref:putative bifunctional diguanylate cyclase/phosphodiesterase n=1 Tax=Thioalkalivibrio sp. ALE30 TaxID=1158181 RepID=UPI00047675C4|nr:EAL domain-containing protein [Thioalkalivibrio sp. ALE30]